ncbi:MAG: DNA-binding protein [Legionellales bacterium]|nr:DNA-binding protein [Legionellales bacterium]|tara:strand:+ start:273 stop:662 length:390 start_codon:yes stop_codon:yes gene_type:complete
MASTEQSESSAFACSMVSQNRQGPISERQTRSEVYQEIAADTGLKRREVEAVFESLRQLANRHLMDGGSGQFSVPGMVKIRRVMKAETKKRTMLSPLTNTIVEVPPKPPRPDVKLVPLKPLKDMLCPHK